MYDSDNEGIVPIGIEELDWGVPFPLAISCYHFPCLWFGRQFSSWNLFPVMLTVTLPVVLPMENAMLEQLEMLLSVPQHREEWAACGWGRECWAGNIFCMQDFTGSLEVVAGKLFMSPVSTEAKIRGCSHRVRQVGIKRLFLFRHSPISVCITLLNMRLSAW